MSGGDERMGLRLLIEGFRCEVDTAGPSDSSRLRVHPDLGEKDRVVSDPFVSRRCFVPHRCIKSQTQPYEPLSMDGQPAIRMIPDNAQPAAWRIGRVGRDRAGQA